MIIIIHCKSSKMLNHFGLIYVCNAILICKLVHAIYRDFFGCKNCKFHKKKFDIFLIFAQNIDCGYTLEPLHPDDSNEYPQPMFWSKNKKSRSTPTNHSFSI